MNKYDVFLEGSFTTLSPLTYTNPGTDKLPVIGGKPYLPSSAIRGKLRRKARDAVIMETGERLDFDDFFFLTLGGLNNESKGKKKSGDDVAEGASNEAEEKAAAAKESYGIRVIQAAERFNPLISLFGAGPGSPVAIPAKLAVAHAIANDIKYPVDKFNRPLISDDGKTGCASIVHPCRTDDARRSPADITDIVSEQFFDTYLERMAVQKEGSDLKKRKADLLALKRKAGADKDLIAKEINDIEQALKAKPVAISNIVLDYEVINPGVELATSMRVLRATENDLALLARAFQLLARESVFGGRIAHGNGLLAGNFVVSIREHGSLASRREVGRISWTDPFGEAVFDGEPQKWLDMQMPWDDLDFTYKALAAVAVPPAKRVSK